LSLPYISEVIVVGVADEEFGQRVGAILSIQEEEITEEFRQTHGNERFILTLDDLRRDLRRRLAGYKLPTLLRVVQGDLPKTASGKVLKKVLGAKYFPPEYHLTSEVQAWIPLVKTEVQAKL
jgi:malonyl-CoA/methylmalonyl-CoA synthetase